MATIIGIDPTSVGAMGWARVVDGDLHEFGQVDMGKSPDPSEVGRMIFQGAALAEVLRMHACSAVVIERAIINSRAVARYSGDASNTGKLTGAVSSSIDVGIACGWLGAVAHQLGLRVSYLNPGSAKAYATGSANANKESVREAARLRVYEREYKQAQRLGVRAPDQAKIKKPSEHIAAAIFVALVGEYRLRVESVQG